MFTSNRICLTPKEITDYLEKNISEDVRFDIEHHMQDCPLCEAAVEGYASTNSAIPTPDLTAVKDKRAQQTKDSKLNQKQSSETKVVPLKRNFNWLAAASVAGLLLFAGWWFGQSETDLFVDFHQPYDKAILATRSDNAVDNPSLAAAMEAYTNKKYSESVPLFETAKEKDPENSTIALYAGLAALENGEYSKSSLWLSEARINQPSAYGTATWYLAMTHLAEKDYPGCRNMLKQLSSSDSPYYEKAQQLLNKLNR